MPTAVESASARIKCISAGKLDHTKNCGPFGTIAGPLDAIGGSPVPIKFKQLSLSGACREDDSASACVLACVQVSSVHKHVS